MPRSFNIDNHYLKEWDVIKIVAVQRVDGVLNSKHNEDVIE